MAEDLHDESEKYNGFIRARVVEVDCEEDGEKNMYGGIRVHIPDIHRKEIDDKVDEKKSGTMAYPCGPLAIGGYNREDDDKTSHFASSMVVPCPGSYVFVFFEGGNPDQCFYFASFLGKQTKSEDGKDSSPVKTPPENRGVDEPHKVYTMIKSNAGRSMIVCDSADQERIEFTGKRRKLNDSDGPHGNSESVYTIDENMTTILIDERDGKEKILIRSYKGDYINFNVEDRKLHIEMESDISIKTNGKFTLDVKDNIEIKTAADMNIESKGKFNVKSEDNLNMETKGQGNFKSKGAMQLESGGSQSLKASGVIGIDGSKTIIQTGSAQPAQAAASASPETPKGDRD